MSVDFARLIHHSQFRIQDHIPLKKYTTFAGIRSFTICTFLSILIWIRAVKKSEVKAKSVGIHNLFLKCSEVNQSEGNEFIKCSEG